MTDYAYETLHPDRVVLRIDPANEASEAVARKTGFHPTSEAPIVLGEAADRTVLLTWEHRRR
jgi:RimJ/RimL family protein N-acetyltransferase